MNPLSGITDSVTRFYHTVIRPQAPLSESEQLFMEIKKARSDIERAEALFNETTNASISDYAAYNLLAQKARYSYLIGLAKEKHHNGNF